ncbi:MAG TPA: DNA cytosine methyltransferase, partial [bacterium]|nr:DNA cytosine methyltransferase [bacterium]
GGRQWGGMNELSLFAGAGGGLLAGRLLGWRTVGYVEWDEYCQRVIARRIRDGLLHEAPIFGDIRAFIDQGYAAGYQGLVDIITGGFPCQPFSVAGKRLGEDDPRNMWPATLECLCVVRPRWALLENVPGLLTTGYERRVFGDLAEIGYDARWGCLSAAAVGAPHIRKRLWIVAHAQGQR